jgi:hypothetical protein
MSDIEDLFKPIAQIFKVMKFGFQGVSAVAGTVAKNTAHRKMDALHRQCFEQNIRRRGILISEQYSGNLPMLKGEFFPIPTTSKSVRLALLPAAQVGVAQSVIVTGSRSVLRNKTLSSIIKNAINNNLGCVVIHCGNSNLEQVLQSTNIGYGLNVIQRGSLSYNPFIGMNSLEISQMLFNSIPEKYTIKFPARDIIRVACEVIFAQNMTPSPATLADCPLLELLRIINKLTKRENLDLRLSERLISDYMSSQSECRTLLHYLQDLSSQLRSLTNDNGINGCDIVSALDKGETVLINVGTNSNDLAIGLLINHMKTLLDIQQQFLIILDEIDLTKYKQLLELTLHNRNGFVLSSDDLISSISGDEKVFSSITGEVGKMIIHSTASGLSCAQWSKYLGEYERYEPKDSTNIGQQGLIGANVSQGQTLDIKREARVPPEILKQLQGTQACIYDGNSNAIMFVDINSEIM